MKRLPPEARDGLMRAWLAILSQRHPCVTWIPATEATRLTEIAATDRDLAKAA